MQCQNRKGGKLINKKKSETDKQTNRQRTIRQPDKLQRKLQKEELTENIKKSEIYHKYD